MSAETTETCGCIEPEWLTNFRAEMHVDLRDAMKSWASADRAEGIAVRATGIAATHLHLLHAEVASAQAQISELDDLLLKQRHEMAGVIRGLEAENERLDEVIAERHMRQTAGEQDEYKSKRWEAGPEAEGALASVFLTDLDACGHEDTYRRREMSTTTRAEHLAWSKTRALECVDRGDLTEAFSSIASDLGGHPETEGHAGIQLGMMQMMTGHLATPAKMREFIEGFN